MQADWIQALIFLLKIFHLPGSVPLSVLALSLLFHRHAWCSLPGERPTAHGSPGTPWHTPAHPLGLWAALAPGSGAQCCGRRSGAAGCCLVYLRVTLKPCRKSLPHCLRCSLFPSSSLSPSFEMSAGVGAFLPYLGLGLLEFRGSFPSHSGCGWPERNKSDQIPLDFLEHQ